MREITVEIQGLKIKQQMTNNTIMIMIQIPPSFVWCVFSKRIASKTDKMHPDSVCVCVCPYIKVAGFWRICPSLGRQMRSHAGGCVKTNNLVWCFICFLFLALPGEMIQFDLRIFFNWVEKRPPTSPKDDSECITWVFESLCLWLALVGFCFSATSVRFLWGLGKGEDGGGMWMWQWKWMEMVTTPKMNTEH